MATCAASEEGTPPGLRSSVSDISFMISDSLRACSAIVREPPLCLCALGRGGSYGGSLIPEPFGQPLLQSHHCLVQRVASVILEDRPGVVERTGHEPGFPSPDLDPTTLLDPSAGR